MPGKFVKYYLFFKFINVHFLFNLRPSIFLFVCFGAHTVTFVVVLSFRFVHGVNGILRTLLLLLVLANVIIYCLMKHIGEVNLSSFHLPSAVFLSNEYYSFLSPKLMLKDNFCLKIASKFFSSRCDTSIQFAQQLTVSMCNLYRSRAFF